MYSKAFSAGLLGMEGFPVEVEVDISEGLPCMELVGALGSEVKEARERVKAALHHCGISLPPKRITVNLSPADRRKEGGGFDLPVAAAILQALGRIPPVFGEDTFLVGELGLDGRIRPVNGILPLAHFARQQGIRRLILPKENAAEGALVEGLEILAPGSLRDLWELAGNPGAFIYEETGSDPAIPGRQTPDFADVIGQESLRRAAEVAAAGMHNLLMVGPPGTGKTMVAERIPGILPSITREEQLELTKIYSVCGLLQREAPLIRERPFRTPHHTVPATTMIGGGRTPKPGEISLAHRGVLFLDELPEFSRRTLEALRQPMESGEIVVSRMYGAFRFPADFMLVAGMDPCPCGHFPDRKKCHCTEGEIHRYQRRISRPLLERIDICAEASPVSYEGLRTGAGGECSARIRERVEAARQRQARRFAGEVFSFNAQIPANRMEQYCGLDAAGEMLMRRVYEKMGLSARSYHKILKVARTIADLAGNEKIGTEHLSEAVSYRGLEQSFYQTGV